MFDVVVRFKKGLPLDRMDCVYGIIDIANDFDYTGYGNKGDFCVMMRDEGVDEFCERIRKLDYVESVELERLGP